MTVCAVSLSRVIPGQVPRGKQAQRRGHASKGSRSLWETQRPASRDMIDRQEQHSLLPREKRGHCVRLIESELERCNCGPEYGNRNYSRIALRYSLRKLHSSLRARNQRSTSIASPHCHVHHPSFPHPHFPRASFPPHTPRPAHPSLATPRLIPALPPTPKPAQHTPRSEPPAQYTQKAHDRHRSGPPDSTFARTRGRRLPHCRQVRDAPP